MLLFPAMDLRAKQPGPHGHPGWFARPEVDRSGGRGAVDLAVVCLLDKWRASPQPADRRVRRIAAWLPLRLPMAPAVLLTSIRVSFDVSPTTMNPLTLVMVVRVLVVPVAFLDLTARLTAIGWVRRRRSRNIQKMG